MSKEFKITSTGYKRNSYLKDSAILDKFLQNHYNIKPVKDGALAEIVKKKNENLPGINLIGAEFSETSIIIDDQISECFEDRKRGKNNKNNKDKNDKLDKLKLEIELDSIDDNEEEEDIKEPIENKPTQSEEEEDIKEPIENKPTQPEEEEDIKEPIEDKPTQPEEEEDIKEPIENKPTKPEKPTTKPEKPTTKPEKPTTKPEKPTTKPTDNKPCNNKPEKPTTKPTTKPEKPTTKPEKPTTKPEKPTTKPEKYEDKNKVEDDKVEEKPLRDIADEFHRILSLALVNRIVSKNGEELKDEEGKIILDSSTLVELISLITGIERRLVVIQYKDPLPPDVGCVCSYSNEEMKAIKDIKSIKINNQDMKYAYNAHYNAFMDDFHISLSHMIHYNEIQ